MGISPDEDPTSYVNVAHGLEVSSQTNRNNEVESESEVGDEIQDCILVKVDDSLNEGSIDE
jgi:hypothetical protein